MKMRGSCESLIPLNGCKIKHFLANRQINPPLFLVFLGRKQFSILLWIHQQPFCLSELLVIVKPSLDTACLIIVGRDNVHLKYLYKRIAMLLQIESHIVLQLVLQRIKGLTGIIIVTFELCRLDQFLKLFLADGVVGEPALDDTGLEILPVDGTHRQGLSRDDGRRSRQHSRTSPQ